MTQSDKVSSTNPDNVQKVVRDKLAAALTVLTGEAQVARWESEATAQNRKHETPGFKEN